jgi:DNA-binding NarL/FixJ family response regulator
MCFAPQINTMEMTSLVLAEKQVMVREALRALLQPQPSFSIVAETGDGLEALRLVSQLKPTVLVTELMMPGLNAPEIARRIRKRKAPTHVVILTMHEDLRHVVGALQAGAIGYVSKAVSPENLTEAIHAAATGRCYVKLLRGEAGIQEGMPKATPESPDPYETLSPREREVFQLSAEGHTLAEIGSKLRISARTAEVHRASMMEKLKLSTSTDLIRYAVRRSVLPEWTDKATSSI